MMSNPFTSFGTQDSSDEEDNLKLAASTSSKTGYFQLARRLNQPREDIPMTLERWIPRGLTTVTNEMYHLAKFCDDTMVTLNELLIKTNVRPLKDNTFTMEVNGEKYDGEPAEPAEGNKPFKHSIVTALDAYLVPKVSMPMMCLFLFSLSPLFKSEDNLDTRAVHHYLLEYNRRWYGYDLTRKIPVLRSPMFLKYFDGHTKKFPHDAVAAFNALEAAMVNLQGRDVMHTQPSPKERENLSDHEHDWMVHHSKFHMSHRVMRFAQVCSDVAQRCNECINNAMKTNPVIKGFSRMEDAPLYTDLFNASMLKFYDLNDTNKANDDDDVELLVMHFLILHVSPSMRTLDAIKADPKFSPPIDFSGEDKDDESFASKMEGGDKDDDDDDDDDDDEVTELRKPKYKTPNKNPRKRPAHSQKKTPASKGSSQKDTSPSKGTRSSSRQTSGTKRARRK